MHLRGKSFTFEALYPDGSQEILLDVPHYDFNWQLTYRLAEPKRLPKGTTVRCTATFDNSADNLANPDPTATVTWGEQSWDEMMIGFFDVKPAPPEGLPAATEDPTGDWTWTQDVRGKPQTSRLRLQFSAPIRSSESTKESPVVTKFKTDACTAANSVSRSRCFSTVVRSSRCCTARWTTMRWRGPFRWPTVLVVTISPGGPRVLPARRCRRVFRLYWF